ncbi:MAG: transcription elongation factor GreA [Oscillospiraceae bacterium]|nr:transcription elongation factor GreA [Oscillospiraceae bacterium]
MEKKIVLTNEGFQKFEKELEELKSVKRKEVAAKIKVALSFGDLSENSEYDEAKNEQAMIEARIVQLETMLRNVQVINEAEISTDVINIGSVVSIKEVDSDEIETYHIVGSSEANPLDGKISDESPIGKALISHKTGDIVEVETPSGLIKFKIISIFKK